MHGVMQVGRTHTGSVNTAYQLLDVTEADGGFVVRALHIWVLL